VLWLEYPQLDELAQFLDAGRGSLGRLRDPVSVHAPYSTGRASLDRILRAVAARCEVHM